MTSSLALLAVLTSASPSAAPSAAQSLPIERWRVPVDALGLGSAEGGDVPPDMAVHAGFFVDYALDPLVLTDDNGKRISSLVANRFGGDVVVSFGFADRASIGVDVPVAFFQNSGDVGALSKVASNFAVTGVGDVRVVPKIRFLREGDAPISLAVLPAFSIPTAAGADFAHGRLAYESGYLGEGPGAFAFLPEVAVSSHVDAFVLDGDLAYRLRAPVNYFGTFDITSEFGVHLAAGYELARVVPEAKGVVVRAELFGSTSDHDPFGWFAGAGSVNAIAARLQNPLEWSVGARYDTPLAGLSVDGGVGAGLLPGYGSPDLRVTAGVRYEFDKRDRDGDGIADRNDKCPDEAEDKDGFQDSDGCPDPDNDGDGVPDDVDKCPNVAGPAAYHGCPPPDKDGDGVPDDHDACPDQPGPKETGGCPDRDGDGVIDALDQCPDEKGIPERHGCPIPPDRDGDGIADPVDDCPDQAGPAKFNGCPDSDGDGIPDNKDKCPNEPETINGVDDDDGCPDEGIVELKDGAITAKTPIAFVGRTATLAKSAGATLDAIAALLNAHPDVNINIAAHVDDGGNPESDLVVTEHQAGVVRDALVAKGVPEVRITTLGLGSSKPVAPNNSNKGRALNRRIEITVAAPAAPPTPSTQGVKP